MKVHELDSAKRILGYEPEDNAGVELNADVEVPTYYDISHGWLEPGGGRAD